MKYVLQTQPIINVENILSSIVLLLGCKDEQGNCHPFGKRRQSDKCVTTECQMRPEGPVFFPVEIGTVSAKSIKMHHVYVTNVCVPAMKMIKSETLQTVSTNCYKHPLFPLFYRM